ncbi:MAG: hypothetical protein JSV32_02855 [Dehalococcoidia bacterium]|nr:MAG: hypothetical protein JSV32_02855 [Dehalococcoidia bacterium]
MQAVKSIDKVKHHAHTNNTSKSVNTVTVFAIIIFLIIIGIIIYGLWLPSIIGM